MTWTEETCALFGALLLFLFQHGEKEGQPCMCEACINARAVINYYAKDPDDEIFGVSLN